MAFGETGGRGETQGIYPMGRGGAHGSLRRGSGCCRSRTGGTLEVKGKRLWEVGAIGY